MPGGRAGDTPWHVYESSDKQARQIPLNVLNNSSTSYQRLVFTCFHRINQPHGYYSQVSCWTSQQWFFFSFWPDKHFLRLGDVVRLIHHHTSWHLRDPTPNLKLFLLQDIFSHCRDKLSCHTLDRQGSNWAVGEGALISLPRKSLVT